jgi:tetratricopeptide (TPR) repeat protein
MDVAYRLLIAAVLAALMAGPPFTTAANAGELDFIGKNADILKRAVSLESENKIEDAAAEYRLYLKKNEDIVPVYFYLGNLYWDSGYKDKARETFKQAEKACST